MKMTFKVILIGGLLVFFAVVSAAVFIPSYVQRPQQTIIAHQYNRQEARGRKLFYSNGCNYCHTQYVRLEDTGMGPVSEAGDYVFDSPLILGSERTGPDLSYLGRKRSEQWELDHLADPRKFSPMSIMPSFEFLPEEDLRAITSYLFNLGNRVAAEWMILPPAPYQNKEDPLKYPIVQQPAQGQDVGWQTWEDSQLQEGKVIYLDHCMTCHGCAGNGLGHYAGTLVVTPANLKQEPFRSMPEEQWFWHVSEGVPGSVMPPWKASLEEEQRWQVIRYIRQIFAGPSMRDPMEGDPPSDYAARTNPLELTVELLDDGKRIFTRECMVCHGDAGRGHGPYRQGLKPSPPDFGDGSYGDYSDLDYFWRVSEGVPWTAMPAWKTQYSEEDRWKVVHYIRSIFTQTQGKPAEPPQGQNFTFPDVYKSLTSAPEGASYTRGRRVFTLNCAHCHGLALDGGGWDGQYLDPTPADFREMAGMQMKPEAWGEHFAKVTFGIQDTAMPSWGEFLPEQSRWDAIVYLMRSAMMGNPVTGSVMDGAQVAGNFANVSSGMWTDEGNSIDAQAGAQSYGTYCATCHGADGTGNGPGTKGNASGGPTALPARMSENYIYWRTWDGVPDSTMPAFSPILSEQEIWDITAYVQQLIGSQGGSR
jgi:mono/diheme cytochrome c family protein